MRVCFLDPGDDSDPFFGPMAAFMRRAASAFDIELEVLECHRDPATLRTQARALVERRDPPDYLLLVNEESLAVDVLPPADGRGIKVLLLNEGLMVPDQQVLGKPGERYKGWLGELVPDDRKAGHILAQTLIEAARASGMGRGGKIILGGIGGRFTSSSLLRINGLRQAVTEANDVTLCEVVPANWEQERARVESARLLATHPGLTILWAASDQMALGAVEAIVAAGKAPGRDILVGGVDWAPFAFEKVRQRTFAATVGGHFLDGAWAIVLLYDLHHRPSLAPAAEKSQLAAVTRDNVDTYERLVNSRIEIDFRRFSKVVNPGLTKYSFSIDAVL